MTVALRWAEREKEKARCAGASTPFAVSALSEICQESRLLSALALAEAIRVCGRMPGQGSSATLGPFLHLCGE